MTAADALPDRALFAMVAVAIIVVVSGTVVGAVVPGAGFGVSDGDRGAHTDPASVEGERDLSALERQLADRLASRARSGSLNISREDAQRARETLNNSQYEDLLNQYADVANETGQVNRSIAFRNVRDDQISLSTAVAAYWDTHTRYRVAGNNTSQRIPVELRPANLPFGPDYVTQAPYLNETALSLDERSLARQLEREWHTVNESHRDLIRSQRHLANITEADVTASLNSTNATVAEINSTQQNVRDEQFTETNLTVSTSETRISYRSPLEIEGRLTTVSGAPIANESVRFAVGNQTLSTSTDRSGQFNLTYRQTTIAANTTKLPIRYLPRNDSLYLDTRQTVPVAIVPVKPNVNVTATPDRVGYGETLTVSGAVGDPGVAVGNVTYLVTIGEQVVATNTTASDGRYNSTVSVPATIQNGTRTVRVSTLLADRALLSANGTTNVAVTETQTTLTASATTLEGRQIRLSGSLITIDGDPVADQQVTVAANGTVLGTVSTGSEGSFETVFTVPQSVGRSGLFESSLPLTLEFRYDGRTTNLGSSNAGASVILSTAPVGLWAGGALAVLVLLGGVVLGGRKLLDRRTDQSLENSLDDDPSLADARYHDPAIDATALLDTARQRLGAEQADTAARIGYLALRQHLRRDIQPTANQTPWEFYQSCVRAGLDDTAAVTLRRATELYEQARFTSTDASIQSDSADDLLDEIASLLTRSDTND